MHIIYLKYPCNINALIDLQLKGNRNNKDLSQRFQYIFTKMYKMIKKICFHK